MLLWLPCVADADVIFLSCGFFYLLLSFFPHQISAIADWMFSILPQMMWPWCEFRTRVWNMLHVACWKYRMQKIAKNWPNVHHCTTLSIYIFATKAHIDSRKKLVKQQCLPYMSSHPHNMVNFSPLVAEIGSLVWGTPANFNRFRILAALLHSTRVVGSANLCLVEQRTPPIFGRAAITLGIGPHSSVRFSLLSTTVSDWQGRMSLKWPFLCQVGH